MFVAFHATCFVCICVMFANNPGQNIRMKNNILTGTIIIITMMIIMNDYSDLDGGEGGGCMMVAAKKDKIHK